jgi:hypothetical protein
MFLRNIGKQLRLHTVKIQITSDVFTTVNASSLNSNIALLLRAVKYVQLKHEGKILLQLGEDELASGD